jgi:ADP-heptose:LPS heptosyltransferase
MTDARWAALAAMCPAIDEVIPIDRLRMRDGSYIQALSDIFRFSSDLRRRKFDAAIDFHGFRETNLLTFWTRAPQRMGLKRADQSSLGFCFNLPPVPEDKQLHVSEVFLKVVQSFVPEGGAAPAGSPLVIPSEALQWAKENLPAGPLAVFYIDAPVRERVWPADRFVALSDHLTRARGVEVVVVTGSSRVLTELPQGVRVLSGLSIPQLAAVIAAGRILVSNDTGPMHLGPALGIPTLGIFSVGFPSHFRPTGAADAYVQGNPIETIQVKDVIEAVERVWAASVASQK